jgi:hypothetical protein
MLSMYSMRDGSGFAILNKLRMKVKNLYLFLENFVSMVYVSYR